MAVDVDAVAVRGRWFKHARAAPPTLPRRRLPLPENRWQRGEVVDAVYLADDHGTAWAEFYRRLAESGLPPSQAMPRDLWTWDVSAQVADLSDVQRLSRVGLSIPRPGRRAWPACQQLGEALAGEGWAGLLAPSAARPASLVLCLFRERDGDVPSARPVGTPVRVTEPPVPPTGMTT